MKRTHLEAIDNEMFRPLSQEECHMVTGGLTKKATGKITFETMESLVTAEESVDGEVDVEFDW